MGKNKEILEEIISDVIEEIDEVDEFEVIEFDETDEIEQPLKIRVVLSANLRPFPNHASRLIRRVRKGIEFEVKEIVVGSLVQLNNIWYEVDGGFIHSSQVELL